MKLDHDTFESCVMQLKRDKDSGRHLNTNEIALLCAADKIEKLESKTLGDLIDDVRKSNTSKVKFHIAASCHVDPDTIDNLMWSNLEGDMSDDGNFHSATDYMKEYLDDQDNSEDEIYPFVKKVYDELPINTNIEFHC